MTHISSLDNLTIGFSDTIPISYCPPYARNVFETVDSSVPYIVNATLNVLLAITTTLANLLVFLAMWRTSSIRLPSKLLLCTLVLTDLGAGLVVQPQFAVFLVMNAIDSYNQKCFFVKSFKFTGSLFCGVSLFTMTAISLDRYTALFFCLRYHEIVTTRRVCAALTFIWSLSLVFASTWLWDLALGSISMMNAVFTCFLVISVANIKIYRRLRGHHGLQVQPQSNEQTQQQAGTTLNIEKYKKTAFAMLWIYILFILCFVPFFCAYLITRAFKGSALTECIREFSYTFVLLNSCLNPFVYCLRLPGIRADVLKQVRKCCRQSPQILG